MNFFCQEEFIRRLSHSSYRDNLILKGGFLLYTISEFTTRPTVDADYILKNYSNDLKSIELLVNGIINNPMGNDFIGFEVRSFEMPPSKNDINLFLNNWFSNGNMPHIFSFENRNSIDPTVLAPKFKEQNIGLADLEDKVKEFFDTNADIIQK